MRPVPAALVLIGEDVSEQLDVEPARFFVHRHIRLQYACRYRWRHGRREPASMDLGLQIPRPPAAVPDRTDRRSPGCTAGPFDAGRVDRPYRLNAAAANRPARRTLLQQTCLHADETPVRQLDHWQWLDPPPLPVGLPL